MWVSLFRVVVRMSVSAVGSAVGEKALIMLITFQVT